MATLRCSGESIGPWPWPVGRSFLAYCRSERKHILGTGVRPRWEVRCTFCGRVHPFCLIFGSFRRFTSIRQIFTLSERESFYLEKELLSRQAEISGWPINKSPEPRRYQHHEKADVIGCGSDPCPGHGHARIGRCEKTVTTGLAPKSRGPFLLPKGNSHARRFYRGERVTVVSSRYGGHCG